MKRLLFILTAIFFANAVFAARVDTLKVYSEAMKKDITCLFISPEGYKQPKEKKHYPTVYLLHGYTGDARRTLRLDIPDLKAQADALQMIIVLADGGYDSWYFDSQLNEKIRYESFITKELVQFTDKTYPTIADRTKRAIYGWSMGGHGALYLAIRHKELYGAAGSICGAVDFRAATKGYGIEKNLGDYSGHEKSWEAHTVTYNVNTLKNQELKLIIDCGLQDPLLEVNRALHQKLIDLKIDHDYIERPGVHDNTYWSKASTFQLLFIHNYFSQS
ncbi:S-formylglutathione hydrolase FrmB [Pedobacter steynii]|uniref:S-formylglutathione hydrolase FrmB n=1 Tax=Pedobacter steynii TaxID=430522 RepID=A0A1G9J8H2_9SPHI|nr:alpha/beta hydrolase family protein [Pedobacter steynii]NQX38168.1 prolyl oligopeptidase family serine peptidase [Pedobacter steynii]SDL33533.1 S-formylglutathione hydrolase FrmB [Pedobacter steynii]